jgi:hypothetical protein
MATEPEIMKVSSDEFDKDPKRYRVQATPGHIVQVIEPSGGTTVIINECINKPTFTRRTLEFPSGKRSESYWEAFAAKAMTISLFS